ncbi:TPA: hypothetical protein HH295_19815 [Xanthomonas vasicola pv. zeae]|uniref:Uncharacterized protein n=2 Tax=Xanthomonas vasicola pv. vasculorum TaxID=325776 RepID=A0A836NZZ5_XANVA|nr:hypothetical protein [Xanthomonas vasicola]AVQ07402.1 hypothetical protein C7V42_13065 [Xanthomonas vasicola pv. vasculorum]AZM71601.1 hypothetical protein CXP37_13075 [Xanthomonas vasicola pv. vasculorum]AZR27517.1 hypothetical protein NX80_014795 [Xanthomonas vasicola pv. arecae]AZR35267.1 hypothetical protein NX08_013125 [Xanthomonas vasicola]KEZ99477.1 hypothetical protein A11M_0100880 [Xanthomonas vasicola pv. vasculorum NCPPB 895]
MDMKAKLAFETLFTVAIAMLAGTASASACCPGDGTVTTLAATGLGESVPHATNLAADPTWRIYEFQREGMLYLQINDATGVVRGAVGRAGEVLWVLPMGKDVNRVTVSTLTVPTLAQLVYQTDNFTVHLIPGTAGERWIVTRTK